jgi:hypothetical protein
VLDIEKLAIVPIGNSLSAVPTCKVLIVGAGLGGVAAAEDLARQGVSVILTDPTSHMGGQLTAQGLCTPDENRFVDQSPGTGTRHYREFRQSVVDYYAKLPGMLRDKAHNVGDCWAGNISAEPRVWEMALRERLSPLVGPMGIERILLRHQIVDVQRYPGNGNVSYVDFVDLDNGRTIRVGCQYLLDASDAGDALPYAGTPWTMGQEARDTYGEPDAPLEARLDWLSSFTYCFDVRWTPDAAKDDVVPAPQNYEYFRSLGQYSLKVGEATYKVLETGRDTPGPFWTYRRFLAASSFDEEHQRADHRDDVSLINWPGNDYSLETLIGKSPSDQLAVLKSAKAFAVGFLHWLQTDCPRDNGKGVGYPQMQPADDELGDDGFAPAPYTRESRRLLAEQTLTENDLIPDKDHPDKKIGTRFADSVGIALYPIDVHRTLSQPAFLRQALPYCIPLGAFIPRSGPANVIPASKDIGASRLAMASARIHPTEWEIGEIAGNLAVFCLKHKVRPTEVRNAPDLLRAFQAELEGQGVTTTWDNVDMRE